MKTLRIARYAFLSGARDYAAIYTWKSWLGGWLLRVLCQVAFFALIGRLLLGSDELAWFLLVGNAVMVAAMEGVWALNLVLWERNLGTLPLLVASPSSATFVYVSRGAYLIIDGTISALAALLIIGFSFGMPFPWPEALLVLPLTLLVAVSAYLFGTFLGGIVLRVRIISNLVINVATVLLMALCGVNIALDSYPDYVRYVTEVLPVTHGLSAMRGALEGDLSQVLSNAALELAVAGLWLVLCLLTFGRFVERGRRDGSIEFAS